MPRNAWITELVLVDNIQSYQSAFDDEDFTRLSVQLAQQMEECFQ